MTALLHPNGVLITGVELDEEETGLAGFDVWRVYVGPRWRWVYTLTTDPEPARAWGNPMGHITTVLAPDQPLYRDTRALAEIAWSRWPDPWNEYPEEER